LKYNFFSVAVQLMIP